MAMLKPKPLKKGDMIGILAPAGAVQASQLEAGAAALRNEGFKVELAEGIADRKGYLAGAPEKRVRALESFFVREEIRAILCARGGFGSIQLLPLLNPGTIRSHPKIFVGYSDVSVLLNWISQSCGLVVFHGPMVVMDIARGLDAQSRDCLWGTLGASKGSWEVDGLSAVQSGKGVAEGVLAGGCLSVVVTTLGTPYEIETQGKVLFLEDVGEKPYRIERMLTHLKMAGKLDRVAAVVLGQFTDCAGDDERDVTAIVRDIFRGARYPVLSDFPGGHGKTNLVLPFGVKAAVDGRKGLLSLLEAPTAGA